MSTKWLMVASISARSRGRRLLRNSSLFGSSQCSFCSAGRRTNKKRRRGKLPLAPTKKDRLRSLEKKPEPELKIPSMDDLNKVGETMESRLTQAQDFFYSFWRGGDTGPRPERTTLNMDRRWWFWNLMFMSLPGITIVLYCEFKAKPEMHELLGKLDEEQRARILGETLEAEEELFEMGEKDVQRLQESVNEELMASNDGENLTLLALKHRLDALESQLHKKDKQLDHLRRYQLERTQQSGVQNRIEDKMITEWKSQSKPVIEVADDGTDDNEESSLSERMKVAVMHGLGENLEAKKEALKNLGEQGLEYGRRLFSGEEGEAPVPAVESANNTTTPNSKDSNDDVVQAVTDAVSHANRAAEIVSSSVSSGADGNEVAQTAKDASDAATEASRAAQAAANAAATQGQPAGGFLSRQWKSWVRKGAEDQPADENPETSSE